MTAQPAVELLDQLDALHAAATPGTWATYWGDHIGADVQHLPSGAVSVAHDVCEMQDADNRTCTDNACNPASPTDDAALIVAAVNALPQLTAAVRAALDVHRQFDASGSICDTCIADAGGPEQWPCPTVRAITAALNPADPMSPAPREDQQ